ncbi:hypothetical protein L9F63_015408, partial [Diploptera punctata]
CQVGRRLDSRDSRGFKQRPVHSNLFLNTVSLCYQITKPENRRRQDRNALLLMKKNVLSES